MNPVALSALILLGVLAIPFIIALCLSVSDERYCNTYHPNTSHKKWEETIHGS